MVEVKVVVRQRERATPGGTTLATKYCDLKSRARGPTPTHCWRSAIETLNPHYLVGFMFNYYSEINGLCVSKGSGAYCLDIKVLFTGKSLLISVVRIMSGSVSPRVGAPSAVIELCAFSRTEAFY